MTLSKVIRAQEGFPTSRSVFPATKVAWVDQKNAQNHPQNVTLCSGRWPGRCYIDNQLLTLCSLNGHKQVKLLGLKRGSPLRQGTRQLLHRQTTTLFSNKILSKVIRAQEGVPTSQRFLDHKSDLNWLKICLNPSLVCSMFRSVRGHIRCYIGNQPTWFH